MPRFDAKYEKELKAVLKEQKKYFENYDRELYDRVHMGTLFEGLQNEFMAYPLRHYQTEALYLLDGILRPHQQLSKYRGDIFQSATENIPDSTNRTFQTLAFEMATGSGKTLLMGAMMLYFYHEAGVKDFFVVTPGLEIYNKSIRNFQAGTRESIWARKCGFKFNVVWGENFARPDMFEKHSDINIYIFNLEKFSENAKKTKVPLESARHLQDENKNLISLQQFLQKKNLIVFADESHHTQKQAKEIIKQFHPRYVLEFSATTRDSQNVVYRYNIKHLLEDGFCKKVMALGVTTHHKSKAKALLPDEERIKMFTVLLVHIAKKYCLQFDESTENLKAISLIRLNSSIEEGEKIHEYLKEQLCAQTEIVDMTLNAIRTESHEIIKVIDRVYKEQYKNDRKKLLADVQEIAKTSIFYHSNRTKEISDTWAQITDRRRPCELVLFIRTLDEGIDMPNIYCIGVINDKSTNLLTSVKQVIGRGVRLNKVEREWDRVRDIFKVQTEKVHIVCDKEKNFDRVIQQIQNEFGVSDAFIKQEGGSDKPIHNPPLRPELLSGMAFPKVKMAMKFKRDADTFSEMSKIAEIVDHYISYNAFADKEGKTERKVLKYSPQALFTEVDVFDDISKIKNVMRQHKADFLPLRIPSEKRLQISQRLIADREIHLIPDMPQSYKIIDRYFDALEATPLYYPHIYPEDSDKSLLMFSNTFVFFLRNHLQKQLCYLADDNVDEGGTPLKAAFKTDEIDQRDDPKIAGFVKKEDKDHITQAIKQGYYFSHFNYSMYKFVAFDSFPEYLLANKLDVLIHTTGDPQTDFWLKNDRELFMEYGYHKYFPDFLLKLSKEIYVFEAKAKVYSSDFKNYLLKKLPEKDPQFHPVLLYDSDIESDAFAQMKLPEILQVADLNLKRVPESVGGDGKKEPRVFPVLDDIRRLFTEVLPVYSIEAACGNFGRGVAAEQLGYIEIGGTSRRLNDNMFVVRATGDSMSPAINDGDYCLFQKVGAGSNAGKILLIEFSGLGDPDTGSFAIKKYERDKMAETDSAEETSRVRLQPLNHKYKEIIIDGSQVSETDLIIAGEFVCVV